MKSVVTINDWSELGRRKGFPAIGTYMKTLGSGIPSIDRQIANINKFSKCFDRKLIKYKPKAEEVGTVTLQLGHILPNLRVTSTVANLNKDEDWQTKWQAYTWLSIQLIQLELEFAKFTKNRSKVDESFTFNPPASFQNFGLYLGNCMRNGWLDEARTVSNFIQEIDQVGGFYDTDDIEFFSIGSQNLIATLILEFNDVDVKETMKQRFIHDELLVWFYENWRTDDTELLHKNLKLLCDRHTQQARHSNKKQSFEFSWEAAFYDVGEVLTILRLREQCGLESIEVDHSLMKTPLGQLLELNTISGIDEYNVAIRECLKFFSKSNG